MSLRIVRPRRRIGRPKLRKRLATWWRERPKRFKNIVVIFTILSFIATLAKLWLEWRNR